MLTSLGKSKQETNGQKIPVIGSKVKVSITPRAAVIQCWCPNPAESSSWCCDPWSSGRAYGLVTGKWDLTLASGLVHGLASRANWLGGQKGDPPLPTHRICAT